MEINYRFKARLNYFSTKQQKRFNINSIENNEKLFTWAIKHFENLLNEYSEHLNAIEDANAYFCFTVNDFEFVLLTPTTFEFTYADSSYVFNVYNKDGKLYVSLLPQNECPKACSISKTEENKNENSTCKEVEKKNISYCATLPEYSDHDINNVCDKEDVATSTINDDTCESKYCGACIFNKIIDTVSNDLDIELIEDEANLVANRIFNTLISQNESSDDYSYNAEIDNKKVKIVILSNVISENVCEYVCNLLDAHGEGKFYAYYCIDSDKTYFILSTEPFDN